MRTRPSDKSGDEVCKVVHACDGDIAAVREGCGDGPEHTEFFARCALVELARAIAEGVTLGICVIGNSSHPFREAV